LSGTTSQANVDNGYGANAYAMQMMMQQMRGSSDGPQEDEAIVAQPGMVTFHVMVNATFELK
jgi:predicted secreted protein